MLKALTAREIEEGLLAGKVSAGERKPEQTVDEDAAVAAAWQAFTDGLYLVFVDGTEVKELDTAVPLREDSRLMFVRLTLLAGG